MFYRKLGKTDLEVSNLGFGCMRLPHKEHFYDIDEEEAAKMFRKAAEQGYATAQNSLGNCYIYGNGVTKDIQKAIEWYRKAAAQGDANAKHNLPVAYHELGDQQFKAEKYAEAFSNLKLAAEDKNNPVPQAMTLLAGCYEYGYGTSVDLDKARRWREEAAKYNDEDAKRAMQTLEIQQ